MSPEAAALCGCWQVIAVERQSQDFTKPDEPVSLAIACYASSLTVDQRDGAGMLAAIRERWSAIEDGTGTPYWRDVTLAEDVCRAAVLASMRNRAIGVHELQRERRRTRADSLHSRRV